MFDKLKSPLIVLSSVVLAPFLVMLMVGSLVFFLIEVLQAGRFEGRLHYTFFFFVFATVLIARMSIEQGSKKAIIYGVGLGAACFVAMMAFVEYSTPLFKVLGPILNIGLMALVWWSAHKLTWDCTHLEDDQRASGRGVLAAAGFDGTPSTTQAEDAAEYDRDRSAQVLKPKKKRRKEPEPAAVVSWWQRYRQYREWRKNKPHTPGVWVLYFALAAIPLFALGQAMIPADDTERRGSTFWQMAVYIGSALGLLVTTTLMGLRRYLEDRNATIPTAMTAAWLGLGGLLIAFFIGVAALLPRPHSETPIFSLQGGKKDSKASKNAVVKDNSAGKGDGAQGQRKEAGDGKGNAKGGKAGGQGKGESSSGSGGQKQGSSGGKQGEKSSGGEGNKGKGESSEKSGKSNEKKKENGPNSEQRQEAEQKGEKSDENKSSEDSSKSDGEGEKEDSEDSSSSKPSQTMQQLTQGMEAISNVVKWMIWIAIAIALVVGLFYFFLKHMSNFTDWAKNLMDWLRGLFGTKAKPKVSGSNAVDVQAGQAIVRPPPFTVYANPFTDGTYKVRSARELTEYTFSAFDSWAWDQGEGRRPEETPREFSVRIAELYPEFTQLGEVLSDLIIRVQFSRSELPKGVKGVLAKFWQALEQSSASAAAR